MSVYSGVALVANSTEIHDCINHLFGAPIPLLLLPREEVSGTCRRHISNQVVNIAAASDVLAHFQSVKAENVEEIKSQLRSILGAQIVLTRGCGEPNIEAIKGTE